MPNLLTNFIILVTFALLAHHSHSIQPPVCIVYMGSKLAHDVETTVHNQMLEKVVGEKANKSLLHHFKSFNGFIARLEPNELQEIARLEGVVSAFKSTGNRLHTTKSWNFLGFPADVPRNVIESDIIIGIIDTGIWPESSSFDDTGFGPAPAKWKGTCETSFNFKCNNKIVGARYYRGDGSFHPEDVASPIDNEGHGTHTASTVAGNLVDAASLLGLGSGTARGGVPSARIAVYKVCWENGDCGDEAIIRAFDDAIADGVDLISISIGPYHAVPYFDDPVAIGSFHAMQHGILTSNSGGNDGPEAASVTSVAPWLLTVAASTIDRKFITNVLLGNNISFEGSSINTYDTNQTLYPIIHGFDAPNITGGFNSLTSASCDKSNSLDHNMVEGKIVVCQGDTAGKATLVEAGASGTIMLVPEVDAFSFLYPLPASVTKSETNGTSALLSYMNSTRNPTATILRSCEASDNLGPYIISFSSRGPNKITPQILKPDLAAPGVHILAAWPPTIPPSEVQGDKRVATFNILSGTSMACPHATGAAAYVKSFHPMWSPAAIKSALMTTAYPIDVNEDKGQNGLAYGAGNINPLKAIDPGLIYDADLSDYISFLCGIGYDESDLTYITGDIITCTGDGSSYDLNLPSFAIPVPLASPISVEFYRTVMNVGSPKSTYNADVVAPAGLNIQVEPKSLSFTSLGETRSFKVKVQTQLENGATLSGSLSWYDGIHLVRSPVVAFAFKNLTRGT